MAHLKFPEDLLIFYLMLLRGQPCSPFKSVQISVNAEYTSVLNCVHFITLVWLCVCIFVWVEVVLSDKGMRLEPPGFIWAKQEGPCLSGPLFCPHGGLRAMNRRYLLTSHTWAPPRLGPTSLSISLPPSTQACFSLSFTTLCVLSTSLPGHGLAYFYLSHSVLFDLNCVGTFHRSCACLKMAHLLNPQSVYEYTFHKH